MSDLDPLLINRIDREAERLLDTPEDVDIAQAFTMLASAVRNIVTVLVDMQQHVTALAGQLAGMREQVDTLYRRTEGPDEG